MVSGFRFQVSGFRYVMMLALSLSSLISHLSSLYAQVTVDATLKSTQIYIGQQTELNLEVSADANRNVELPKLDSLQQIVEGVEVVSSNDPDTELLNNGARMVLRKRYVITAFDSALYYIPPMKVKVDADTFESKSLALKVYTAEIDTTKLEDIFGMHPEMAPIFAMSDWKLPVILSLSGLLIALLFVYLLMRMYDNKPVISLKNKRQRIAPHKKAMEKIELIRTENLSHSEDTKEYYTRLTDVLRQYISERFGFNAMEMTSTEIVDRLMSSEDKTGIEELRDLLATADLVKFAKQSTELSENDRNLLTAADYINQTKKEEVIVEKEEETVEEVRSRRWKTVMRVAVISLAVMLVLNLGFLIYKLVILLWI